MNINKILKREIKIIKPDEKILSKINRITKDFVLDLNKKLKAKKIKADVFIGGSLAKNTLVNTDDKKFDIDIFVRFDKKYKDKDISKLLKSNVGKAKKIHGSRDYFQILKGDILLEIIPVIKIKKPEEAQNVTDLSYFHVKYVSSKIKKNKKLANEIILGKAFCHAQDCYGAESYIHGFSGYSLELLMIHYKSFLNFIKAVTKLENNRKLIIDDSGFYNKNDILMEMNESKIQSPIILIDPTFKERNALAGLSIETFSIFKKACHNFLQNPSNEFFKKKDIKEELKKYKNLITISLRTTKQKGDISGTKSKKFFNFFVFRLRKEFIIKLAEFEYKEKENIAYFYLVLDEKPDEIIKGPPITNIAGLKGFRKAHPNAFIKNDFAYSKVSHKLKFSEFFRRFLKKDKKIIKEMKIKEMKIKEMKII